MRKRNQRLGRNDPCPCGSGRKYKLCHGETGKTLSPPSPQSKSTLKSALREYFLPHAASVWVASDVFERALSWDEAKRELGLINWESAILSMAMVNAVSAELALGGKLNTSSGEMKLRALADYLFPPELRANALSVYLKHPHHNFIPLAPQACIAMTEACLRYCNRKDGLRFHQPHQHASFSHVLFSFHEQLMRRDLTPHLNIENLSAEQFRYFVRNYLAANLETDFAGLIRRQYMMFEVAVPNGALFERTGKNAATWFTEIAGTDPIVYRTLLLFTMHHGFSFTINNPNLEDLVYDIAQMLQNVAPEYAAIYRRLHDLASVEDTLPAMEFPDWESALYGAHYVRRKPVLRLDGSKHVCLYRHLLPERFFAGTVHVLSELAVSYPPPQWPNESRERVFKVRRELGYVFEDYVRQILGYLFQGTNVELRFGVKRDDGGESDALVVVGSTALVFEFVHHPWSLLERSKGESSGFIPHVADNVRRAGLLCAQIAHSRRAAELERPIDSTLPIVIMSEMMAINEVTALTWQHDLIAATSSEMVMGHGIVQPLQTLSLIQLENLDRLDCADSAAGLVSFLSMRARDPVWRLSGHASLRQNLGRSRRLKEFDDAAERSFHEMGPKLFHV